MKTMTANLHVQRKKAGLYLLGYIVIILLLTTIVAVATTGYFLQLHAVSASGYTYSAIAPDSSCPDTYYKYNAGISFSTSKDAKFGINAEVVMQTENAKYTDLVYWDVDQLSVGEIAISQNIADANELAAGDILYSKNVIDGEIRTFTIRTVLPAISYTRGYIEDFHSDGVIIMGYDRLYADNIAHTCIIYTKEPIEVLALNCSAMPEDIIYRDDEMLSLVKNIAPYMAVYILATGAAMAVLAVFLSRMVAHNFRRLMTLGFDRYDLNKAYFAAIGKTGVLAVAVTVIVGIVAFSSIGRVAFVPVGCVTAIAIIVLLAIAAIMNKHLWRK